MTTFGFEQNSNFLSSLRKCYIDSLFKNTKINSYFLKNTKNKLKVFLQ
jgi:hypothetical protein